MNARPTVRAFAPGLVLLLALMLAGLPVRAGEVSFGLKNTAPSPGPAKPAMLEQARQLLVVTAPGWNSVPATLQRYQRADAAAPWQAAGNPVPVGLGKKGLARCRQTYGNGPADTPLKKEGDGKSPAGAFRLPLVFAYAPETPRTAMPVLPVTKEFICVDDPASLHYNTILSKNEVQRDWKRAEKMRRKDGLYRLGVLVAYNVTPTVPGAGSCIFLHLERGPQGSTSGCTAMAPKALREIVGWLDPARQPVLVQLPEEEYLRLRTPWQLP